MLSALVIYVEYEDANIAGKKYITRVSGISLRCPFHQFMIKRQTKTSIHLIMLSFIIINYVKEYFIATFSIQPNCYSLFKKCKSQCLKIKYITSRIQYDHIYTFTSTLQSFCTVLQYLYTYSLFYSV